MTVLVGTRGVVKTFATELVPAQVRSYTVANQQTPAQKWEYIAWLMSEGKSFTPVGRSTNDAVAVTQAGASKASPFYTI
ncbi:putative copper-transporting P-type ATPase [Colletotrichum sublineola]|uniref:Putative copper-transporting P-type ATPase n=1 Tax=Colletotrichum sublineola TaxID=1173701 RepID=A0A066XBS2_COLSU|nr:putative copper-transporting P-type ATPase [Colletotrichum sublineola]